MRATKLTAHIGVINHDGSGTVITSMVLVECRRPLPCKFCEDSDRPITVDIEGNTAGKVE